jgi:hypothetical protein
VAVVLRFDRFDAEKDDVTKRLGDRLLILACLVAIALPAGAHHSISGQFDLSRSVTLTGTIDKVDWINPHAYVYLRVPGTSGAAATWALSTVPLPMLRKAGLTRDALAGKPGEMVTVSIHPSLDPKKRLGWLLKITYPDGHFYLLSSQ